MDKVLINFENIQSEFKITEKYLYQTSARMIDYILKSDEIIQSSVLNDYNITDILLCFDVLICDNEQIKEINREYRGKDKPTDVISFALFADSPDTRIVLDNQIHLGQIIISAQKTEEQAKENKKSFNEEFLFLLSHGILHLLGFDHIDDSGLKLMLEIQDKMIGNIIENV